MSLVNCKDCGKLQLKESWSREYCADCLQKRTKLSITIRGFLETHPKATILDVHRGTGIPLGKLLDYQREQREQAYT
ncbi:hypothetical protein SD70_00445 [Gordoniibacillus kamchatkensis]|uniref:Uncharacterized protein n=2 Tax=Gordoniibacillus kamchatkensis TaxID=1590651 RepID=A0ABR5APH1_9BACL|nr:hypothetical protein SD70_00445 [Paenibacillus sp. VKM B-2647]